MKLFFVLLVALPAVASAHEVRHQGAHVHGQAEVQLGVDAGTVEVRLQAPGKGILTFERPPATEAEAGQLKRAVSVLEIGKWIVLPAAAGCVLTGRDVKAAGFSDDTHAHHEHEDHDQAGHAHDGHHHAGFEANLQFQCRNPSQLTHLQILLADQFPGLQKTVVESATPAGQGRVELLGKQQRVELKR